MRNEVPTAARFCFDKRDAAPGILLPPAQELGAVPERGDSMPSSTGQFQHRTRAG